MLVCPALYLLHQIFTHTLFLGEKFCFTAVHFPIMGQGWMGEKVMERNIYTSLGCSVCCKRNPFTPKPAGWVFHCSVSLVNSVTCYPSWLSEAKPLSVRVLVTIWTTVSSMVVDLKGCGIELFEELSKGWPKSECAWLQVVLTWSPLLWLLGTLVTRVLPDK